MQSSSHPDSCMEGASCPDRSKTCHCHNGIDNDENGDDDWMDRNHGSDNADEDWMDRNHGDGNSDSNGNEEDKKQDKDSENEENDEGDSVRK